MLSLLMSTWKLLLEFDHIILLLMHFCTGALEICQVKYTYLFGIDHLDRGINIDMNNYCQLPGKFHHSYKDFDHRVDLIEL